MSFGHWLKLKLKEREFSVIGFEQKTEEMAIEINQKNAREYKKEKARIEDDKTKSPDDKEKDLTKLDKQYDQKSKVSSSTLFRIMRGNSEYRPSQKAIDMIELVLGEKYSKSELEILSSKFDRYVKMITEEYEQKKEYDAIALALHFQHESCLLCYTGLNYSGPRSKEYKYYEISLLASKSHLVHEYEILDTPYAKNKVTVLVCNNCTACFDKIVDMPYKALIDELSSIYSRPNKHSSYRNNKRSQQFLADSLQTSQPVISRILTDKVQWVDSKLAIRIHEQCALKLNSEQLENDKVFNNEEASKVKAIDSFKQSLINIYRYPAECIKNKRDLKGLSTLAHKDSGLEPDFFVSKDEGIPIIACFYLPNFEEKLRSIKYRKTFSLVAIQQNIKFIVFFDDHNELKSYSVSFDDSETAFLSISKAQLPFL